MKQTWMARIVVLACLVIVGCRTESERLADMAERTVEMQSAQNRMVTETNEELTNLNRDIQTERKELNQGFKDLEQGRQKLHQQRRSELAWSESFRFLAIVIAAVAPLFLCAYLIWAATHRSLQQEEVNAVLIRELASSKPRLIAAPNLPAIEHRQQEVSATSDSATQQKKKQTRSKSNVPHSKDHDTNP